MRLGYCLSSIDNISMMNKYRNPKSINLFAQVAGIESLNDLDYIKQYVIPKERLSGNKIKC